MLETIFWVIMITTYLKMEIREMSLKRIFLFILLSIFLFGCAGIPVREEVKVNLNLPIGRLEGDQFIGIRYPFKLSIPSHWKVTTEIPIFMEELGYEKPGLEESEVFIFNPFTQSNIQIDFTPAGRYSKFDQQSIEWLTTAATGSFKEEMEKDYGKDFRFELSPTEPISLKGVQFAARKYARYSLKGIMREQGWIYGFSEPYQLFILYMILEMKGVNDREDIKKILDSFEVLPKR